MKKQLISMLLAIVMVLGLLPGFAITASAAGITPSQPANGDGSADNPYQITTAEELYWFAEAVNGGNTTICADLMNNITVNTGVVNADGSLGDNAVNFTPWTPIGHQTGVSNNNYAFKGTFDGKGHTISGLYHDSSIHSGPIALNSQAYKGLFGYVGGATIKNVTVADSYFYGTQQIGGIVGQAGYSNVSPIPQIINCHVVNSSINGTSNVGGIVGFARDSALIESCTNAGYVTGEKDTWNNDPHFIGGIVGYLGVNSTVTDCHNIGVVSSADKYVGGVVGGTAGTVTVQKSSNTGTVSGTNYVSGVVGYVNNGSVSITDCYNAGAVTATSDPGYARGIVYGSSSVGNCHNYGSVTGTNVAAIVSSTNSSNCYYLDSLGLSDTSATAKSAAEFANDTVVDLLNAGRTDAVWVQGLQYPVFKPAHTHDWQYTADGSVISADCSDPTCDEEGGSVTLIAPGSVVYTGSAIEAVVTDTLTTGDTVTVAYAPTEKLTEGKPVQIGSYTASVTLGSQTFEVAYDIVAQITLDAGGGTCTEQSVLTDAAGKLSALPDAVPADDSMAFIGWYTAADGGEEITTDTVFDQNDTIYARYAQTYTVTIVGGGEGVSGAGDYVKGATVSITAGTKANHTFAGWMSADGVTFADAASASTTFVMLDQAVTVTANWQPVVSPDDNDDPNGGYRPPIYFPLPNPNAPTLGVNDKTPPIDDPNPDTGAADTLDAYWMLAAGLVTAAGVLVWLKKKKADAK